jgi:soluble lytic murein transglycosylase
MGGQRGTDLVLEAVVLVLSRSMSLRRWPAQIAFLALIGLTTVPMALAREDETGTISRDVLVTGSLPIAPGERLLRPISAEPSELHAIIALYAKGDVAGGDRLAAEIQDREARTLLEWVAIRSGGSTIRHARIAAFIENNLDWPGITGLRRRAEEALMQERASTQTVQNFFAIRQPLTAAGKIALAKARMATGQTEEAIALVRQTWRQEHIGAQLEDIVIAEFGGHLTRADHRSRTERYLLRNNREAAYRNARRIGADYVKLADARFASARKSGASQSQIDAVPASLRGDISFAFLQAQSFRRQNKPVEAAKAIAHVPRDADLLGDGDEWWNERRLIARKLLDIGENETAYRVAANHRAVTNQMIIEAEWHAGWIALQFLKDPARASSHFAIAASVAETPISVTRAAYWQGRAAEAMGHAAEAESYFTSAAKHPVAYYGQLARLKLGWHGLPIRRAVATGLSDIPGAMGARLLYGKDETRALGTSLLFDLARHLTSTAELEAVAQIAHQARDARTLLAFGKIALQRGYPLDTAAFPTHGIPAFQPVGAAVERAMVHAIARQESAFDPRAVSHAGARGLMQMMPATARETARRTKTPFDLSQLTADPAYCARLGAAHLGDLMGEWRGSLPLVFAAYNAGSGNVRDWIKAYGDPRDPNVDAQDWIERIPFSETRNYVQRVSENIGVYRQLLYDQIAFEQPSGLIPAARRE